MTAHTWKHWLVTTLIAAVAAGILSGIPSTLWGLVYGDPLEPTLAAGSMLVGNNMPLPIVLLSAAIVHASMSMFWSGVLTVLLPKSRTILNGVGAGVAIAVFDLLVVGQFIEVMRALPFLPQLADHMMFGGIVGAVVAWRRQKISVASDERWSSNAHPLNHRLTTWLRFPTVAASFVITIVSSLVVGFVAAWDAMALGLMAVVFAPMRLFTYESDIPLEAFGPFAFLAVTVGVTIYSLCRPTRIGWLLFAHAMWLAYFVLSFRIGQELASSLSI